MVRVLFWNIQQFSLPKIRGAGAGAQRLGYITRDIFNQNCPDVFVIVEVKGSNRVEGANGGDDGKLNIYPGGQATFNLLQTIRQVTNTVDNPLGWRLIPPITTAWGGAQESVAVYYNANRLQFVGPFIWTQNAPVNPLVNGQARPRTTTDPNTGAPIVYDPANYPAATAVTPAWNSTLPAGRNTPINFNLATENIPENQLAGQWWWPGWDDNAFDPNRHANDGLCFPYPGFRKPLLTQFLELNVNGIGYTGRIINLYSLHLAPSTTTAVRGLRCFNTIAEINTAVSAANNIDVVAGDFNIDSFNAFRGRNATNPYYRLVEINHFTMQFPPYTNNDGANPYQVDDNLLPYRLTHYLPVDKATPFNNTGTVVLPAPTHNVYSRLGCMGSTQRDPEDRRRWIPNNSGAIDNIFVRYGAGTGGPATRSTIANTVVGTPYVGDNNPNQFTYDSSLNYPPENPFNNQGYPDNSTLDPNSPESVEARNRCDEFRDIENNFGFIHSVSDHLPIIVDI